MKCGFEAFHQAVVRRVVKGQCGAGLQVVQLHKVPHVLQHIHALGVGAVPPEPACTGDMFTPPLTGPSPVLSLLMLFSACTCAWDWHHSARTCKANEHMSPMHNHIVSCPVSSVIIPG